MARGFANARQLKSACLDGTTATAVDANNQNVPVAAEIQGTVDSVEMTQNPPVLTVAGQPYTLSKIRADNPAVKRLCGCRQSPFVTKRLAAPDRRNAALRLR